MPHLSFPITANGLEFPAVVGLAGPALAQARAAVPPLPAAVPVPGLIDTATNITLIAPSVVSALALASSGVAQTLTAAGPLRAPVYRVSLFVQGPDPNAPLLLTPTTPAMEWIHAPPDIHVVVGLDVLVNCFLIIDGPGQRFMLGV